MKQNIYYVYCDERGNPVFRIVRTPDKKFWAQYLVNEKWEKGKGTKIYPYRLPELLSCKKTIFVVGGEKDSENLIALGFNATTNPFGEGNFQDEIIHYFKEKILIILNDNDPKGFFHRYDVIKKLYGTAAKIYFLDLPGLPEKGDVSDWIDTKRKAGLSDPQIADALKELCTSATLVTSMSMAMVKLEYAKYKALAYPGQNQDKAQQEEPKQEPKEEWPDPEDILMQQKLAPVLPYTGDLLPDVFSKAVKDISERMQAPSEFSAITFIVEASSIIAYRINMQPKQFDSGWTVCPNLWGALIGSPSVMKSPAMAEGLTPLKALDKGAEATYENEKESYFYDVQAAKSFEESVKSKVSTLMKSTKLNMSDESKRLEARNMFQQLDEMKNSIPEPKRRRYIVQDGSIEKLQEYQAENAGHCILLKRDELTGFFKNLEKAGHEADRTYFLESWDGASDFANSTITRGETKVENNTLSLIGTMQPSMIRLLLAGTISGSYDDGLFQRLQLAVYPDVKQKWELIDRKPDFNALDAVFQVFKDLAEINPEECGFFKMNKSYESQPDRYYLKFDNQAQQLWNQWWTEWELWIREENLPEYLVSHFTKYRKLVPSLALILYLLTGKRDCYIDVASLLMAIKWADLLKSHAFRIYGQVLNISETTARLIAERIIKKELDSEFTLRDLKRKCWSGINEDTTEKGLETLQEAGWGKIEKIDTNGRPSSLFKINPLVFQKITKGSTAKTDKSTVGNPFDSFDSSLYENISQNKEAPVSPEVDENLFDTSFIDNDDSEAINE